MDALIRQIRCYGKGYVVALAFAVSRDSDLFSYSSDLLTRAVNGLLSRAGAAGEIRNDISPEDLLRALSACATRMITGLAKERAQTRGRFYRWLAHSTHQAPNEDTSFETGGYSGGS